MLVSTKEIIKNNCDKIESFSQSEEKEKDIHFAAVRIQRCLRGYNVRKVIKKWHKAATTIQRYVRGFLVRWHLPELYAKNLEVKYCSYYNRMATKIQALWRGYCVNKFIYFFHLKNYSMLNIV